MNWKLRHFCVSFLMLLMMILQILCSSDEFAKLIFATFKGRAFVKGTSNYEDRRLVHNGLCKDIYPDWIIVPESSEDVASIIKITNIFQVPISVRSGGHSFTCSSTRQGKKNKVASQIAKKHNLKV